MIAKIFSGIVLEILKGFQKGCTCNGDAKGRCSGTTQCSGPKTPYTNLKDIGNMKIYSDKMNFMQRFDEDDDPDKPETYDNNEISNFAKQFHTRECVMGPAGARTTLHRYQPLFSVSNTDTLIYSLKPTYCTSNFFHQYSRIYKFPITSS